MTPRPLATAAAHAAPVPELRAGTRRRGVWRVLRGALGEAALWIAAAFGMVAIVLVILALTLQITLIMFRTGSMAPAIPAGSVAVVQRVPATSVELGDVVTVDRDDALPVTHRVVAIASGASPNTRSLTLRGDANPGNDPAPYDVASVRIVRASAPGLAPVIVAFGDPFVLGALTLGASLLIGWAFWPRQGRGERHAARA